MCCRLEAERELERRVYEHTRGMEARRMRDLTPQEEMVAARQELLVVRTHEKTKFLFFQIPLFSNCPHPPQDASTGCR